MKKIPGRSYRYNKFRSGRDYKKQNDDIECKLKWIRYCFRFQCTFWEKRHFMDKEKNMNNKKMQINLIADLTVMWS